MRYRLVLGLFVLWAGIVTVLLTTRVAHSHHVLISTVRDTRYDARTGISLPLQGRNYTLSMVAETATYAPSGRYRLTVQSPGQFIQFILDDFQANAQSPVTSEDRYVEADTFAWLPGSEMARFIAFRVDDEDTYSTVLAEFDVASRSVRTLANFTEQMGGVFIVTFSPSRERVGVWSGRQRLYVWDIQAGQIAAEVSVPNIGAVRWRDERHVLYEVENCVYQWDTETGNIDEVLCTDMPLWSFAPSPDGTTLALAWEVGERRPNAQALPLGVAVGLYDFPSGELAVVYQTTKPIGISGWRPLAWSPDGRYLYSQFNTVINPDLLHLTDVRTGRTRPLPERTYYANWETEGQLHYATR